MHTSSQQWFSGYVEPLSGPQNTRDVKGENVRLSENSGLLYDIHKDCFKIPISFTGESENKRKPQRERP